MSEQNNLGPGQCGADREVFERVWRRVMPEDRPDCPFTLYSEEETEQTAVQTMEGQKGAPVPPPALPPEERGAALVPVPAEVSGGDGAVLQALIADELSDWRTYQALARHPRIVGVKESGGLSLAAHTLAACPEDFTVWSGSDELTVPMMSLGAAGVISVASNLAPEMMAVRKCKRAFPRRN